MKLDAAVRAFLANPPAGSKTRAAMDFGIDISLTIHNMFGMTPRQRLKQLEDDAKFFADARRSISESKSSS